MGRKFKRNTGCLYILMIFIFFTVYVQGQNNTKIELSNSTLVSSGTDMPFWMWANRDGMVRPTEAFLDISWLGIGTDGFFKNKNWHYDAGATLSSGLGKENYLQVNQLFTAIDHKGWKLECGIFYDELQFGGLSSTNGNLARSRNARPVPKIRFSTSCYKPVPILKNWLSFRFEYDEGLLDDERYVEHVHLHHKSVYLKVIPAKSWEINMGLEHFVMWGGSSPDNSIGDMPTDFKSYILYIIGSPGDSDFPLTDQLNVAGNQYGTYQLSVSKKTDEFSLHFNISHPFEDGSGTMLENWTDNLLGVFLDFNNQEQFISEILYEYVNTKQQGYKAPRYENDNYFNHGVYKSGATYHQMAMVSPLFSPVSVVDGISLGFLSTRFYAHHLGAKGRFMPNLYWKGFATYSKQFGTYASPYGSPVEQVSLFGELWYKNPSFPFDIKASLASDMVGAGGNNIYAAGLTVSKTW